MKNAKHHVRRTVGNNVLSFEELTNLICRVKKILNSRPIGVGSDDPKDGKILMPAHLIRTTYLENFAAIEKQMFSTPLQQPGERTSKMCFYTSESVGAKVGYFLEQNKNWRWQVSKLKMSDVVSSLMTTLQH